MKHNSRRAALRGRLHPALPVEGATRAPLISEKNVEKAVRALHKAFDLGKRG